MFTIENISKDTGLTIAFIRKCLKEMSCVIRPHCKKGDCNQLLFTENGYVIFDQIKQLKEQGLNITAIKEQIENQLTKGFDQSKYSITDQEIEIPNTATTSITILNRLVAEKDARMKEQKEHQYQIAENQKQIMELQHLTNHLKGQLLYLTDGHTPEEVKQQWQQEQMEKQRISWILKELENLEGIFSVVNYFKRKKLYKELKELMNKQANTHPNEQ